MKSYRVFIEESAQDGIEQRFALYKTYAEKYLKGRRSETFIDALNKFSEAVKVGQIYNPVFKEAYSYGISRGLDEIYEEIKKLYDHLPREDRPYSKLQTNSSFSGPMSVNSYLKAIKGHEQAFSELNQFLNDFKTIKSDIDFVKTLIVAGRAPKPVDPNKFVKPPSSFEAKKKVAGFLDEAVRSFKIQYEASVRADYTKAFMDVVKLRDPAEIKQLSGDKATIATMIFIVDRKYDTSQAKYVVDIRVKDNSHQILERLIQDTVDNVILEFISKNTSKLSLIFDKKEDVKDHKILSTKIRHTSLENDMYFEFTDSSNFIITSDIVYAYSKYNKPFIKLVTRFRNVKLADGSSMSSPSEEKMIKEF